MKTLKTFIVLLVMIISSNSYGQTKEETEQWLNEKFKKIVGVKFSNSEGDGFCTLSFSLKDGLLNSSTKLIYARGAWGDDTYIYIFPNIPFNRLNEVVNVEYGKNAKIILYFQKYINYGIKSTHYDNFMVNKGEITESNEEDASFVYLCIPDIEENLAERIKKALEHYATFFPKPEKKKETF